jgi:hypothetical protein
MTSSYSSILRELLESVDGAVAAGFADYEGETIQLEGDFDDYSHRLQLAYQEIVLHRLQDIHKRFHETLTQVRSAYWNYHVIVQPLCGGYFLVLTLSKGSNLHQAQRHLEQAAHKLNQDL